MILPLIQERNHQRQPKLKKEGVEGWQKSKGKGNLALQPELVYPNEFGYKQGSPHD